MWLNEGTKIKVPEVEDYRPLKEKYPDVVSDSCAGLDMYKILGESNITINRHTNAANGDVGNMRMFEATGMGACILNDSGDNMQDIFEEDSEIVTYSSDEECIEKLTYLLNHPEKARETGEAGQKRTLKDHSLQERCEAISLTIQALFN
jgi:spore maturation protein CgeB